ncbi:PREDICTED: cytoplasmic tRNA 2-thiolation protein 2, partial [Chaetura pelagica]|uniref:cytoplasmic tRNA 2-thiolation protein 2 n=1 Tax=Chaetura pelagica TaxID=8897 RepID=UPI0005239B88
LTLHLCQGLSRETAKRLRFVPGLVYVDEGSVRGQSPAQREQSLAHMETLLQEPGFSYHLELQRLFEAVETPTAREELLQMLRLHLILQTARTRGYTKVMTGESCTRVAIKLLTNLALGRGAFLAVDTGFVDNRHGDVMVVRPMREYTAKEIAFYKEELALEPTLIVDEPEFVENGTESKAAFIPLLCYSCRLTFKELGPLPSLPPYVRAEAQRRICR